MNYLLDTHAFIWYVNGESDLSSNAKKAIEHKDSNNFISIATIWEMAIKVSLGKLILSSPFSEIPAQIEKNGFQILEITFDDTLQLSQLPFHHRDPFDRLIIAQSIANRLTLISKDKNFSPYGVTAIW